MLKVSQADFIKYPYTTLYLDDIKSLLDIFNKNFEKTNLIIDGYQISDLSKISELKKQFVTEVKLEGGPDYSKKDYRNANMTLTLSSSHQSKLYLSDRDDVILLGIASKVNELLKKRKV